MDLDGYPTEHGDNPIGHAAVHGALAYGGYKIGRAIGERAAARPRRRMDPGVKAFLWVVLALPALAAMIYVGHLFLQGWNANG